jgi:geranylgeranyl reductase family protein
VTGTPAGVADALVVGAGAAGAAAAFHLARLGHRVVVLDQARFPRPKACGGGMAASVQRLFPFDLTPAVDAVIQRVRFSWCLEDPVVAELPGDAPFWIVRRAVLDQFLTEQAVAEGAIFLSGWRVTDAQRQEGSLWRLRGSGPEGEAFELEGRAVVIADGSESTLAARLGLGPDQPQYATTVSVELDGAVLDPHTAWFEFGLVRHGFCWAFPRQGGASIGVGSFIGREAVEADAVLNQLLPALGHEPSAGQRRHNRLRIWSGHHPLHGRGVLVVGDAASLCDPFLAEGLRPALISGCEAAVALDRWLRDGDDQALGGYSARMRQCWGESMAWGRRIAQVFYRLPRVGYQLGIKRPTAPQRIAQILSGEMGYGDIAQRVIRRLLFQRG